MFSKRSIHGEGMSGFRRVIITVILMSIGFASPGQYFPLPATGDLGNEGERPVSMFDPFFRENGNLFCDRGLKATGFRVLPDMTIQGTAISPETLEALVAFQERGERLKADAQDLEVGDFLGWQWWPEDPPFGLWLYLPDWDKGGWTFLGDATEFRHDLVDLVETLPDFMNDILGAVPNMPLSKDDWDDFGAFDLSSFEDALDSFKSFFDGTFFVNLGKLVSDFTDPPESAVCVNDTRRQTFPAHFRTKWTYWALQNQRKQLQRDVSVAKVCWLGAHNAYNNYADGYVAYNNWYSITDMLRAGIRFLALDVYHGAPPPFGSSLAQLSHAGDYPQGALFTDRYFYNAIKEIRNWMLLPENQDEIVWIEMQDGIPSAYDYHINHPIEEYLVGESSIGVFTPAAHRAYENYPDFPSQKELLDMGCRAICLAWNSEFGGMYVFRKPDICLNKYGRKYDEFDTTPWPPEINYKPAHPESPLLGEIAGNRLYLVGGDYSPITQWKLAQLVRYNVNFIGMDMVLAAEEDAVRGDRLKGAVWSWREDEWETDGASEAAMMGPDGRWSPRDPSEVHYFAAARPVSETIESTGEVVETFEWKVTTNEGTWSEGGRVVLEQFGNEYTFAVPLNAYQNSELMDANTAGEELWLNYGDIRTDGTWEINTPPVAVIEGPDTAEEAELVAFTGVGSSDPDGDPLVSYEWSFGNGDNASGMSVTTVYGDDHAPAFVTLTVTDSFGGVGQAVFPITVFNLDPAVTLNVDDAVAFAGGDAFLGRLDDANRHSASAVDPGSDDLTFTWSLDDLVFTHDWVNQEVTYFNNGVSPDPLPSSAGTFPFIAADTAANVTFESPGVFRLNILVTDDDGGTDAFDHPKLVMGAETLPKGLGYWRKQFSANGRHHVDDDTLRRYLAFVEYASGVFSEIVPASTVAEARAIMQPAGAEVGDPSPDNKRGRLAQTIFQAWLNFASGAIGWDARLRGLDQSCLRTIYECEQVFVDPNTTPKECLTAIQVLRSHH